MSFFKKILGFSSTPPAEDAPIPDEVLPFLRKGWTPVTAERPAALDGSKFCGAALIPAGEEWPRCGNCSEPLRLFVQLSSAELPEEAAQAFGEGILQFFYCTSSDPLCESDAETWVPFNKATLARIFPLGTAEDAEGAEAPGNAFPERAILGWEPLLDLPNEEELGDLGVALDDEVFERLANQGMPAEGDKLLGWPCWVQGVEYPSCPTCSASMKLVFQIDSEKNVPHMFGDVGCGHLFQCPNHPEILGFGWACH
jgi:hypothetical protein